MSDGATGSRRPLRPPPGCGRRPGAADALWVWPGTPQPQPGPSGPGPRSTSQPPLGGRRRSTRQPAGPCCRDVRRRSRGSVATASGSSRPLRAPPKNGSAASCSTSAAGIDELAAAAARTSRRGSPASLSDTTAPQSGRPATIALTVGSGSAASAETCLRPRLGLAAVTDLTSTLGLTARPTRADTGVRGLAAAAACTSTLGLTARPTRADTGVRGVGRRGGLRLFDLVDAGQRQQPRCGGRAASHGDCDAGTVEAMIGESRIDRRR